MIPIMVGRVMTHKHTHVLIAGTPGICEYVLWQRDFINVVKYLVMASTSWII